MEDAPFHINYVMICARFDKIITEMTYTDDLPPLFMYKLWEVREMIKY